MDQYKKYLATKILNEDVIVTYSQLSRALKVHTHLAKQMLYDFHHNQNAKKPNSIHATYCISGVLKTDDQPHSQPTNPALSQAQDEDTPMDSSPFPSSFPEESMPSLEPDDEPTEEVVQNSTVLLCMEEEFDETQQEFDEILSIFIYSLQPGPIRDYQLLLECNRQSSAAVLEHEDPRKLYKELGIISNKNGFRRRNPGKRPPLTHMKKKKPEQPAKAAAAAATDAKAVQPAAAPAPKAPAAIKNEESKPPAKPALLTRQSSDLFKSFAKSKPPKIKTTDSNPASRSASASANHSPVDKEKEDAEMAGMSDDGADEVSPIDEEAEKEAAEKALQARRARKEKDEKLRQMMEESDEEMADANGGADDEANEDAEEDGALDKPQEEEKREEVVVSGGRRRGRRKVMKKRTYKDEDGYLVTKEEAAWESFSEDEPEPKKPKMAPVQVKKKVGPAPKGQGNLMNFFKKK